MTRDQVEGTQVISVRQTLTHGFGAGRQRPGGLRRVREGFVELEWYDGTRAGIANIEGVPHYFRTEDYIHPADEVIFLTWRVDEEGLEREIECWDIFVDWNDRYEAGEATADSHPGIGGLNARYDELQRLLDAHRTPPKWAVPRQARWRGLDSPKRYVTSGPSTEVRWSPSPEQTQISRP